MEKIYSEQANTCEGCTVKKETIDFLLQYSKTLHVLGYRGFTFESNLNYNIRPAFSGSFFWHNIPLARFSFQFFG